MTITVVVERAVGLQISGWGWDAEQPDQAITVAVSHDETVIAQARANNRRRDVLAAGVGTGNYGFTVQIPLRAYDTTREFGVTVPGSEASIIQIDGRDLSVSLFEQIAIFLREQLSPCVTGTAGTVEIKVRSFARDMPFVIAIDAERELARRVTGDAESDSDLLTIPVPRKFADGVHHRIDLFAGEPATGLLLATFVELIEVYRPSIRGYFEGVRGTEIVGWCVDDSDRAARVSAEIYIDNDLVRVVTADGFRQDLLPNVVGGIGGFSWQIPFGLRDGRRHRVEVIPVGATRRLPSEAYDFPFPPNTQPELHRFAPPNVSLSFFPEAFGLDSEDVASSLATFAFRDGEVIAIRHVLHTLATSPHVTVVVPVYNAVREVESCLMSLLRNTTFPCTILLIDDESSDDTVWPLLKRCEGLPNVHVVRNETNIGYTKTCNWAIGETNGDLVFLNSDTYVPPRWLERLVVAAYREVDIGTVTALSDNSGAFSLPLPGAANPRPTSISRDAYATLMSRVSGLNGPSVATGNGFCMYVRRALLNDVGGFDATAFPRGYGEENDFCMRALKAGWKNVIDDRSFVFHVRSASFGSEKPGLFEDAQRMLGFRHPEYTAMTSSFGRDPRIADMRRRAQSLTSWLARPGVADVAERLSRPRLLYTLHYTSEGGTALTTRDLVAEVAKSFECFLLTTEGGKLLLDYWTDNDWKRVATAILDGPIDLFDAPRPDYETVVAALLLEYDISVVHVRHLIGHSMLLPRIAARLGIPTVMSFHDYYMICPSVNLLDEAGHYCAGQCTPGFGNCRSAVPLPAEYQPLKHGYIHTWRERVRGILPFCTTLVTTSRYVRDLFCKIYPEIENANFRIIEHGRDNVPMDSLAQAPQSNSPIRVLILGNVTPRYKGYEVVQAIKRLDTHNEIEFHFLGHAPADASEFGIVHGRYNRDRLREYVAPLQPAVVGIFSIWAETYCHTLSEAWQMGVPVIGSDLGAIAERIDAHGGGWTADCTNPHGVLTLIRRIRDNPEEWERQRLKARADNLRPTAAMACDYAEVYKAATLSAFTRPAGILRIVLVGSKSTSLDWWSDSARTMTVLQHPTVGREVNLILVSPFELLHGRYWLPGDGNTLILFADDDLTEEELREVEYFADCHNLMTFRVSDPLLRTLLHFLDERVWSASTKIVRAHSAFRVAGAEIKHAAFINCQGESNLEESSSTLARLLQEERIAHLVPVVITNGGPTLSRIAAGNLLPINPAAMARQLQIILNDCMLVVVPPSAAANALTISERELGMMGFRTLKLTEPLLDVERIASRIREMLSAESRDRADVAGEAERQFGIHANAERIIRILRDALGARLEERRRAGDPQQEGPRSRRPSRSRDRVRKGNNGTTNEPFSRVAQK